MLRRLRRILALYPWPLLGVATVWGEVLRIMLLGKENRGIRH